MNNILVASGENISQCAEIESDSPCTTGVSEKRESVGSWHWHRWRGSMKYMKARFRREYEKKKNFPAKDINKDDNDNDDDDELCDYSKAGRPLLKMILHEMVQQTHGIALP